MQTKLKKNDIISNKLPISSNSPSNQNSAFFSHISQKTFSKSPKIYLNLLQKNYNDAKTQKETLSSNFPKVVKPKNNEESKFLYFKSQNPKKNQEKCWSEILDNFLKNFKKSTTNFPEKIKKEEKQQKVNFLTLNPDFDDKNKTKLFEKRYSHRTVLSNNNNANLFSNIETKMEKAINRHNRFISEYFKSKNSTHSSLDSEKAFKIKKIIINQKNFDEKCKSSGFNKEKPKTEKIRKINFRPFIITKFKEFAKINEKNISSVEMISPWKMNENLSTNEPHLIFE